ncbi:MAG: TIGR03905 family TSCPD domain-containing protein [Clostridia bacterium]|nr:TIGR03905 family TSCPD domain-containing protein [Clostridia bacterium]
MRYSYQAQGVCARQINFDIEGNVITNIEFIGGCDGNHKSIASILEGSTVEFIEERLSGVTCGFRDTSCGDQLAVGVRKAYDELSKK